MNATATIQAGDRVCTVARDGARCANTGQHSYPIWTGAIYEAARRKRDGRLTWRRVGSFGGTRSGWQPSPRFVNELMAEADHEWHSVRHGQPVE